MFSCTVVSNGQQVYLEPGPKLGRPSNLEIRSVMQWPDQRELASEQWGVGDTYSLKNPHIWHDRISSE
jgi:hypothetical protein